MSTVFDKAKDWLFKNYHKNIEFKSLPSEEQKFIWQELMKFGLDVETVDMVITQHFLEDKKKVGQIIEHDNKMWEVVNINKDGSADLKTIPPCNPAILENFQLNEWFPDKESLIYFEHLAKAQKRIYPDAADYGIRVELGSDAGPTVKTQAREHLGRLMKTYGSKIDKWATGSETKVFIPTEEDMGLLAGALLVVEHNIDKKRKVEFLTINIKYIRISEQEARNKYGYK